MPALSLRLPFVFDDGGRAAAGFRGKADDCVARAVAIAADLPYAEVYAAIAKGVGAERGSMGATARRGVHTRRKWFRDFMLELGFTWVPTMYVGKGCTTHLSHGELPMGRLVVKLSKHTTAVVDGVIHDTFDPSRESEVVDADGSVQIARRCVYGYWVMNR
ncbi:hypothetical protein [Pseudomonas sp. UMAB-40]|uniref:hypothetical protein n=1 Tax=Pseudomonas sp. UMAB-40 TaxID=1365407 RepID=UPI001C5725B2|nr:hypothetical protein [Pseudomonas sp. UMAB-40]